MSILSKFAAASAKRDPGANYPKLPYEISIPELVCDSSPSVKTFAEGLTVALENLRIAIVSDSIASFSEQVTNNIIANHRFHEHAGQDVADAIRSPPPGWNPAADAEKVIKGLGNGAFIKTSNIYTSNWRNNDQYNAVTKMHAFLASEPKGIADEFAMSPDNQKLLDAIENVQTASCGYILHLADHVRDPYALRAVLACVDKKQLAEFEAPAVGHPGHIPPAGLDRYDQDPKAWAEENYETGCKRRYNYEHPTDEASPAAAPSPSAP